MLSKKFLFFFFGALLSFSSLKVSAQDKFYLGHYDMPASAKQRTPIVSPKGPIFEMVDVEGNAINPKEIMTLNNGMNMPASVLFAELEKAEREWNKKGYSIQNFTDDMMTDMFDAFLSKKDSKPAKDVEKTTLDEQELDNLLIDKKKTIKQEAFKSFGTTNNEDDNDLESLSPLDIISDSKKGSTASRVAAETPISTNKYDIFRWEKSVPSSRNDYFNAKFESAATFDYKVFKSPTPTAGMTNAQRLLALGKTSTEINFNAFAKLEADILNSEPYSIVDFKADAKVPANATKPITIDIDFVCVGSNIFNWHRSYGQSFAYSGGKSFSKEFTKTFNAPAGPVVITGEFAIKGSIGVDYQLDGTKQVLHASVTPKAELGGFAKVGASLLIVEVSLKLDLIVLRVSLPVDGKIALDVTSTGMNLSASMNAKLNILAFQGKLTGNIEIGLPRLPIIGKINFLKKSITLLTFTAYQNSSTLFDVTYPIASIAW